MARPLVIDRILDRVLALGPLAVLAYFIHRGGREQTRLIDLVDRERDAFRNERRELINRIQAPHMIPTATRPAVSPAEQLALARAHAGNGVTPAEQARTAYSNVGRAAPASAPPFTPRAAPPTDADDVT